MNLPFGHPRQEPGDPGSAYDARPMVAIQRQDQSAWWFAGGAVIAAVLLFSALEARRRGAEQASSQSAATGLAAPESIPELEVPFPPAEPAPDAVGPAGWTQPGDEQPRPAVGMVPQPRVPTGQTGFAPESYTGASPYQMPPPAPLMVGGEATQTGAQASGFEGASAAAGGATNARSERVTAGRLENPATTVVQGTLINAVLETALDSTRPGQTRAVVTRDIFGFDGTRMLIPRGTRLYGVYGADVAQGQKRAQIRWTRLLRPDGVSVALDSPAADPLGRAGVRAKVNNHFLQRFGNALLGTTANIGSALMTQSIGNSPVVVAVPGSAQTATQAVVPNASEITPTLTVRQGTRITVFVQHDLDFSTVDEAP